MNDDHRDGCQCHGCVCSRYELEIHSLANDIEHERQRVAELEKERDELHYALENCRLFAARNRKESWALLILGFLAEAGVVGSITREEKTK